jgi:hypothetical protein
VSARDTTVKGMWGIGHPGRTKSSGTIDFDRLDFTVVTVNVDCDGTTADFAIFNG